jgi:excinuclease ABC subunit A
MAQPRPPQPGAPEHVIRIRGARVHNLRNISLDLPRDRLIVFTGLSGSGKSSLAFDTIYAEGQRRYVESLSTYARQFLEQLEKPDVDYVEGLPPTIAIEQKQAVANPRSTVATTTEIHDYLRLLFARCGEALCPGCGKPLRVQTREEVVDSLLALPENRRFLLLAPLRRDEGLEWKQVLDRARAEGFVRVRVDGAVRELNEALRLEPAAEHAIEAVVDRLVVKPDLRSRLAESLETALRMGEGLAIASIETPSANGSGRIEPRFEDRLLSDRYACAACRTTFPDLEPRLFSFNSPEGACPACDGLGTRPELDPDLIVPDRDMTLAQGAIEAWKRGGKKLTGYYDRLLADFAEKFKVNVDVPFRNLPEDVRRLLMYGTRPADVERLGQFFEGVIPNLLHRYERTESPQVKARIHQYMSEQPCPACRGARLRPEALAVRLSDGAGAAAGSKNIADICRMNIAQADRYFRDLRLRGDAEQIAPRILKGIRDRLHFLVEVGVGYLTLDRSSATLSGGEAQRIRLATQVGSGLVGICYVLDEPTIGLHQRDNARLLETLVRLRDAGNTVIVVEHDEQTIRLADYVVDMGPGAGAHGGEVIAKGTLEEVLASPQSLTASYLKGELEVAAAPRRRRVGRRAIEVLGVRAHNLKGIDVRIPLGGIVCVTGVSGSGKSTLVRDVLYKALARRVNRALGKPGEHDRIIGANLVDKVIEIDQSPIGRTPRSNPATFSGVMNPIRRLFASLKESAIRGYDQSRFSFNVKGGRCEACQGQGEKRIEMHFLPDVFVRCEQCRGKKYNREILEIKWKGLSIADVLDMTVESARRFFKAFPRIKEPLKTLEDVGLGYLTLGQSSTTLSGGEAQRLKLAAELSRGGGGHTLYLLDEPTTGLHFADISRLMDVLNRLADLGNTLVVIEHNLDVIKSADWVIDLGPEGGEAGGTIVCEGPPEAIARCERSHTGRFLGDLLARAPLARDGAEEPAA